MPSNPLLSQYILGDPGADSGSEGKSKRAGKHGTKTFPHPHYLPLGLQGYTGTGVGFQGIDGIPPPKHPSLFPGGNVDPVVMVPIHTIPNAPTHLTILFDQSLSTKKPISQKSQSEQLFYYLVFQSASQELCRRGGLHIETIIEVLRSLNFFFKENTV